jgi:hypothetical protein
MIFCTLFNWAYLPQGIALYRSLERTCKDKFVLHVLCVDGFTADVLTQLNFPHLRVIPIDKIEDEALKAVRATRTIAEFCWTCTTPLLLYLLKSHGSGAVVTYVDADLRFFSDPSVVFAELGSRSILIHEHDFSSDYAHLQRSAGRFNVGLIAVRNDEEGRACLEKWKAQCFDECIYDPAAGKCGDQNYLDEWPRLYPGLVISANPGVGRAPWNIAKNRLSSKFGNAMVDGHPIVFYHYHALRLLRPRLGFKPVVMVKGNYIISEDVVRAIYRPYVRELWRAVGEIEKTPEIAKLGHAFTKELSTLPRAYPQLSNDQMLFSLWGFPFPGKHNAQLMSALYGIDAEFSSL